MATKLEEILTAAAIEYYGEEEFESFSFLPEYIDIIEGEAESYEGTDKEKLKDFFVDLQRSGISSGMVGAFIYNSDIKKFYVDNLDDLEDFLMELEDRLGEPISNDKKLPRYTFVVWLTFEEFCYNLYTILFEDPEGEEIFAAVEDEDEDE